MKKEIKDIKGDTNNLPIKNPDTCKIEELTFVFNQSEKRLNDSMNTFDSTTAKSINIIGITSSISSALIAYFFVNNDFSGSFSPKLFTVLMMAVSALLITFLVLKNILPTNYQAIGSQPRLLLNPAFYNMVKEKSVIKNMIYSEIVNYDNRIEYNYNNNKPRLGRIRKSLIALISLPILGICLYIITSVFKGF